MDKEERPSSEKMLEKIQAQEERVRRRELGQLKIFLGYAAGTGKMWNLMQGRIQPHFWKG